MGRKGRQVYTVSCMMLSLRRRWRRGGRPPLSTPVRRQYLDIKARYPDAILFFRLGDFYETFDADAELVSRELEIALTSKPLGKGLRVPLAGVPVQSVETHLARLIRKGTASPSASNWRIPAPRKGWLSGGWCEWSHPAPPWSRRCWSRAPTTTAPPSPSSPRREGRGSGAAGRPRSQHRRVPRLRAARPRPSSPGSGRTGAAGCQ